MSAQTFNLPTTGVDQQWLCNLELLEARIYPLPGGSCRRQSLGVDERLAIQDAKESDIITFYEHVASVRHKPTGRIYVAFRETMDSLLARQKDPEKYPKWLMNHQVKKTELRVHIMQAKVNPKPIAAAKGLSELWFNQWLKDLEPEEDIIHQTLAYFLLSNNFVHQEMFVKA